MENLDLPGAVVRQDIATVDHRVTESLVRVVNAHLRADAPPKTLLSALLHLLEMLQVVLDTVVTVF